MKAIWKGWISFGLINIPVNLYSGTAEKELSFHLLHKKDLTPIRYARICTKDEHEIPWEEIVKGYELKNGAIVPITPEDFEKANVKRVKSIEILDFVDVSEIDSVFYEKPYYLEPQKGAAKAYLLLLEALNASNTVGIAKFVLRNREHLSVIKPYKGMLVLNQLRFSEELRPPTVEIAKAALSKREIDMAVKLIEELTVKFNPKRYKDEYRDELMAVIKRKAKGRALHPKGKVPKKTPQADFIKVLKASIGKRGHAHRR